MNSAQQAADDIFVASILHHQTMASSLRAEAADLRSNGKVDWAEDYERLAVEHDADAARLTAKSEELVRRLSAISGVAA